MGTAISGASITGISTARKDTWYPNGGYSTLSNVGSISVSLQAGVPVNLDTSSTKYKFRTVIRFTLPSTGGYIDSVTLGFKVKKTYSSTSSPMKGTLMSTDPITLSTLGDTNNYRSYAVSGTNEVSVSPNSTSLVACTCTFTGQLTPGGTYYACFYTDANNQWYTFEKSSANYTISCTYINPTYTITFDANGGTVSPTSATHTNGSSTTLPTPTRDGYNFVAWVDNPTGAYSREYYSPFTENLSGNITMYAWWSIKTYNVSYNANGRGSAPASQTKTHGVALTLQPFISQQTATGYQVSFNANNGSSTPSALTSTIYYNQSYWNTNSSGTGTNYGSGGSYTANSGTTLYAIWSSSNGSVTLPAAISRANGSTSCTVTFNANGGSCSTSSLTSSATVTYTFNKWAAGSTSGTQYSAGASYTPTAATTMYATWSSSTGSYGAISLPTPTRDGYNFKGWSTSSSATSGSTGDIVCNLVD